MLKPLAQGYTSGKWWHPDEDVQIKMQSMILNHHTTQPLLKHGKMDLQPRGKGSEKQQECLPMGITGALMAFSPRV